MLALQAYLSSDDSDNDNETTNSEHNNTAGTSRNSSNITSNDETISTGASVTSLSLNNRPLLQGILTRTGTRNNQQQNNDDNNDTENNFVAEQHNITRNIISGYVGESSTNGRNSGNERSHSCDNKRKKSINDDDSDDDPVTERVSSVDDNNSSDEYHVERPKRPKIPETPIDGTALHIANPIDNKGRSFIHPPLDVAVHIPIDLPIEHTFLPKRTIHTWEGHTKGVSKIRFFPKTAHLLLSCGNDNTVKLWEVYKEKRCIRTYRNNHIDRDINFDNDGSKFLSSGDSNYVRLWDTETGIVISRFTNDKIPYCVKFNPDTDKQNLFIAGTEDYKIICWDTRTGNISHEYNKHTGSINTITFFDNNQKFITTSEDKNLRVWKWGNTVDIKCINDTTVPAITDVALSKNNKLLACQTMENKIYSFCLKRLRFNHKKIFTGHNNVGNKCTIDFSPNMYYLVSGDADGKCHIWNSKKAQNLKSWKAHDGVCNAVQWNPHDPSKLVTAGSDSQIKYWE